MSDNFEIRHAKTSGKISEIFKNRLVMYDLWVGIYRPSKKAKIGQNWFSLRRENNFKIFFHWPLTTSKMMAKNVLTGPFGLL